MIAVVKNAVDDRNGGGGSGPGSHWMKHKISKGGRLLVAECGREWIRQT